MRRRRRKRRINCPKVQCGNSWTRRRRRRRVPICRSCTSRQFSNKKTAQVRKPSPTRRRRRSNCPKEHCGNSRRMRRRRRRVPNRKSCTSPQFSFPSPPPPPPPLPPLSPPPSRQVAKRRSTPTVRKKAHKEAQALGKEPEAPLGLPLDAAVEPDGGSVGEAAAQEERLLLLLLPVLLLRRLFPPPPLLLLPVLLLFSSSILPLPLLPPSLDSLRCGAIPHCERSLGGRPSGVACLGGSLRPLRSHFGSSLFLPRVTRLALLHLRYVSCFSTDG